MLWVVFLAILAVLFFVVPSAPLSLSQPDAIPQALTASLGPASFGSSRNRSDFLIQDNQLLFAAAPFTVEPQVLGSLGGTESEGSETTGIKQYQVQSGDTLSQIASDFDLTLNTLLWANDLSSDSTLQPGQELLIPPVSGVLHGVNKGETLSYLAQLYQADLDRIVEFNGLESKDDILAGDLLIIPGGEMPSNLPAVSHTPVAESYFIYPAQGKITQGPHGFKNNAIDVANQCGTPVVAAAGGTVQRAGIVRVGGKRVTILHPNGVITYYGHLSSILVRPGQKLNTGDIIGYIGNSGFTLGPTGCHIHFAVRGARNFLANYSVGSYLGW